MFTLTFSFVTGFNTRCVVNGVRPQSACVLRCFNKLPMQLKELPQFSQEKGLTPVCNVLCVIRLCRWQKPFPQT